jgi:hypothetical protein
MSVEPFEQLADAIARLPPFLELGLQLFGGLGFDIHHRASLAHPEARIHPGGSSAIFLILFLFVFLNKERG